LFKSPLAAGPVPPEIVFDQGLGSVFVVRVAGNIIDSVAMGSIEFSVKYLGVKAVLVMGHEACARRALGIEYAPIGYYKLGFL